MWDIIIRYGYYYEKDVTIETKLTKEEAERKAEALNAVMEYISDETDLHIKLEVVERVTADEKQTCLDQYIYGAQDIDLANKAKDMRETIERCEFIIGEELNE